jgi:hypothetical protein
VPSDQAKIGQEGLAKAFKAALTEAILQNHVIDESLRVQKLGTFRRGYHSIRLPSEKLQQLYTGCQGDHDTITQLLCICPTASRVW